MAVQVRTEQYEAAHGKAPRGKGSWAFVREASHGEQQDRVYWAPMDMTYREACAWMRRQVRAEGFQDATVHVGS